MSMPRPVKKPDSPDTMPVWSRLDDVDGVGHHVLARRPDFGAAQVEGQVLVVAELLELGFEPHQRVPVAADQQQHGEFAAQRDHAALGDAAAAVGDGAGQVVDQAGAVGADGGNGNVLPGGQRGVSVMVCQCTEVARRSWSAVGRRGRRVAGRGLASAGASPVTSRARGSEWSARSPEVACLPAAWLRSSRR